ncbi:site-specific integrase [Acinetobacter higginsii]|uniref:tyrosine-type recombinase/integrase n=1 Tax=Acinetobacter higginsii TaxID=70347 RepID=UPI00320BB10D
MQKPVQRGNAWRITLRHNGQRFTATRDTAQECEQWAAKKLLELQARGDKGQEPDKIHLSFYALFDMYYKEAGRNKKSKNFIDQQLKLLKKQWGPAADLSIHDLSPQIVKEWRDKRLKEVKPATISRQFAVFSAAFNFARKELFLTKENPFKEVNRPPEAQPRNQRVSDEDIEKIIAGLDYQRGIVPTKQMHYVAWAFLFALETAMRKGEILSIEKKHVYEDFIRLTDTKNGKSRDVPLTKRAKELLAVLSTPFDDSRLIPHNANSFRLIWQRNLTKTGLVGKIRFHDTRHEAITRFVHNYKLPIEILSKITGHETLSILVNTYYNPTATEIARMLDAA